MNTLLEFRTTWKNTLQSHVFINESFTTFVNAHEWLNTHRTKIETEVWGFGERSFHWLYYLVVKELPNTFSFLDIGVFRGASGGLVSGLAELLGKQSHTYALSPFDGTGVHCLRNYEPEVIEFFKYSTNNSSRQVLTTIKGLSQTPTVIDTANSFAPYDACLIDAGHSFWEAKSDILTYAPMIKVGGYIFIDDSNNDKPMPWGYFCGIKEVSDAVHDTLLTPTPFSEQFEFVGNVVHLSLYKRIK